MSALPNRWFFAFSALAASVGEWATSVVFPLEAVGKGLRRGLVKDTPRLIARHWSLPIFLTILVDGVVLHLFGVELVSEYVFAILYGALMLLRPFFEALLLYFILRIMKVEVSRGVVFVCYTAMVIYAPIFNWLQIPSLIESYSLLAYLKSLNLDVTSAFSYVLSHGKEIAEHTSHPLPAAAPYFGSLSGIIYLAAVTVVAECLHQLGKMSRLQAYGATGLATALNVLPFAVFVFSRLLLVYSYIKAAGAA